jgi:polysaccharide pyruvyl transferase WcaK-like protein
MKKEYNVSLIGLEIDNDNLGCVALTLSFINILEQIGRELGAYINITAIGYSDTKYACSDIIHKYDVIRVHPKQLSFWKQLKKNFREADVVFDFTLGDSFSDIYGAGRYIKTNLLKDYAEKHNCRFVLGPQTYGPYKSGWSKAWATKIIKRAFKVYSRDMQSANVLDKMCQKHVSVVTDVAFGLPYTTKELEQNGKIKVAFNPSGLLWKGGYTENNQFDLSIDYQDYCKQVVSELTSDSRYEVYLIPHVGGGNENGGENDYGVCKKLHESFPNSHVVEGINSPIDAKDYISAMDVLIAARMHATVAGVSTGCATIPVAYSRKFMGLYENIGYNYVLDIKALTTEQAINQTIEWVRDYKKLQAEADSSQKHVQDKLNAFKEDLVGIFKAI